MDETTISPDPQTLALVQSVANGFKLDMELVCAVCEQESEWNPWAIRYEPEFFERYESTLLSNLTITTTEANARATSWGLLQVMGQTAREHGWKDDLPKLCIPAKGLLVGCDVLSHKLAVMGGNVVNALQSYNGGSNPNYATEVLARVPKYKPQPIVKET